MKNLVWNVYYHDCNSREIKVFNIFGHGGFRKDVEEGLKKCETKEEFAKEIHRSLFYYYGSKCEWEIVLTSWVPRIITNELDRLNSEREKSVKEYSREPYSLCVNLDVAEKVDVREQVMLNFDIFLDYVWSHKSIKRTHN